jgi:hypothetical protein
MFSDSLVLVIMVTDEQDQNTLSRGKLKNGDFEVDGVDE